MSLRERGSGNLYNESMENSKSFEKALVQIVAEMITLRGFKHSAFGRFVFGEKSGARLWRVAREADRGRVITVDETVLMADFFHEDYVSFMRTVYQQAKSRKMI